MVQVRDDTSERLDRAVEDAAFSDDWLEAEAGGDELDSKGSRVDFDASEARLRDTEAVNEDLEEVVDVAGVIGKVAAELSLEGGGPPSEVDVLATFEVVSEKAAEADVDRSVDEASGLIAESEPDKVT